MVTKANAVEGLGENDFGIKVAYGIDSEASLSDLKAGFGDNFAEMQAKYLSTASMARGRI